jgi:hypothetical protein
MSLDEVEKDFDLKHDRGEPYLHRYRRPAAVQSLEHSSRLSM